MEDLEKLSKEELINLVKNKTLQLDKIKTLLQPQTVLYKNDIDLVNKAIDFFSLINIGKIESLRNFEKEVLNYYIRFGCNKEAKEKFSKELNKNMNAIRQATFYLTKKNYLKRDTRNFMKRELNKDLLKLVNSILNGSKPIVAVGFKRSI